MTGVSMDSQVLFNILVAVASCFGGFILKSIADNIKQLQVTDAALIDKISSINILVAGEYLKRSEFEQLSTALFRKLDKIEEKLADKVDVSTFTHPLR